jgi:SAM-dependent methyltransferase
MNDREADAPTASPPVGDAVGESASMALKSEAGRAVGLDPTLHPSDNMGARDPWRYFAVGADALRVIRACLVLAGVPAPARVLDHACGFGRVGRHLRAAFPGAQIVAADVWAEAVAFVEGRFADRAVRVSPEGDDASWRRIGKGFDLVWCGSLLTHLPPDAIDATLARFAAALAPGGVAVVTTHGRFPRHRLATGGYTYNVPDSSALVLDFDEGRHGFAPYAGHGRYGASLSPLPLLTGWVTRRADLTLRLACERAWDDHQDVVCFQKRAATAAWNTPALDRSTQEGTTS